LIVMAARRSEALQADVRPHLWIYGFACWSNGSPEQRRRRRRGEAVDMILSLTSFAMFAMLHRDRPVDDVCALVKTACRSALDPLLPDRRRSSRS
jgi:hypothetical protein